MFPCTIAWRPGRERPNSTLARSAKPSRRSVAERRTTGGDFVRPSHQHHAVRIFLSAVDQASAAFLDAACGGSGDRLPRPEAVHLSQAARAHPPAGERPRGARRAARRHGRRARLGHAPVSRGVLRHSDDGRDPADGERSPVARAVHLHDRARRRDDPACQRRIPRASRRHSPPADQGQDGHSDVGQRRDRSAHESDVAGHYEDMLASASPEFDFPDFDENTQATTFYTSGTTGLPKGVYFSHRQMVAAHHHRTRRLRHGAETGTLSRESVYMPITPMFHVHAWGFPVSRRPRRAPSRSIPAATSPICC